MPRSYPRHGMRESLTDHYGESARGGNKNPADHPCFPVLVLAAAHRNWCGTSLYPATREPRTREQTQRSEFELIVGLPLAKQISGSAPERTSRVLSLPRSRASRTSCSTPRFLFISALCGLHISFAHCILAQGILAPYIGTTRPSTTAPLALPRVARPRPAVHAAALRPACRCRPR